jgi:Protein of unknown function (DUF4019)
VRLVLAACALAFVGCALTDGVAVAEDSVIEFREQYAAGIFGEMYDAGSDDLRTTATRDDFMTTLASLRTKLGSMRESKRTGFNARVGSDGTFVVLEYLTEFENGTATEEFTWEISGGKARLLGYSVDAKALLR